MPDLILVRLVPTQPKTARDFYDDLQDLEITAYDLSVDSLISGIELGTAKGVVALEKVESTHGMLQNVPADLDTTNSKLSQCIMQHFIPASSDPSIPCNPQPGGEPQLTPENDGALHSIYAAVATAVIVVDIAPDLLPHPEYPTPNSFDLRLDIKRNGFKLDSSSIAYNVAVLPVRTLSKFQWDYMAVLPALIPPNPLDPAFHEPHTTACWEAAVTPSAYVYLPPAQKLVTIDVVNGQPPDFSGLVNAIDSVLSVDHPSARKGIAGLLDSAPLTQSQSQHVASELVWSRVRYPLPTPPTGLELMYTKSATVGTPIKLLDHGDPTKGFVPSQKKWEGSLSSYQSIHDAEAHMLANFVFAASAAVYAETQSAASASATLQISVQADLKSSTTINRLRVRLEEVNPVFVIPAAYFYALGTSQSTQISPDARYHNALGYSEDQLMTAFKDAIDSGILQSTQAPVTIKPVTTEPATTRENLASESINLYQAARRIICLGTQSLQSTNSLKFTDVSTIVTLWLRYTDVTPKIDGFWATVTNDPDYLTMILHVITAGDTGFIKAIKDAFAGTANLTVQNLLKKDCGEPLWVTLFKTTPSLLPPWTLPGSTTQRINAFLKYLQTILTIVPLPPKPQPAISNGVAVLKISGQNAVAQFVAKYIEKHTTFDFSEPLDASIDCILSTVFPSDHLRTRTKQAIKTIHSLCQLTKKVDKALQFSYMEALYARGFTTAERIALLTETQFAAALRGTVAYSASSTIYPGSPSTPDPASGFSAVNPGGLEDCIPAANLSPLGRIQYLHDMLQLSIGSTTLANIISARRGALGTLNASLANLEPLPRIDLVNETLEAIGSNLSVPGAVFNTSHDLTILATIIPEHSSPSQSPPVYKALETDMSTFHLPYSQGLDICRIYLCPLGTSRFETMRHFRTDITEFVLDPNRETTDFQPNVWRFPVRLDIAIEYLCISKDELKLYTTSTTDVASLFGYKEQTWTDFVTIVPTFLGRTGLTYHEFIDLWKCGYVPFSPGDRLEYPVCPSYHTRIVFIDETAVSLWKLAVFIRLWRKLVHHNVSFSLLADICTVFRLFEGNVINADFIRQLASLLMLHDFYELPISSTLALWSSTATPEEHARAVEVFVYHISRHARARSACPEKKDLVPFLKPLSRLAGFTDVYDWHSKTTCTLRFAEVLAKICASKYAVGELLFSFTANEPFFKTFPLSLHHTHEDPFNLPDDCDENLWKLRHKLMRAQVSDERACEWTWDRIEDAIGREFGLVSTALVLFGEHYFPSVLGDHGYRVPKENIHFRVQLSADNTNPAMWHAPPYGPFRYYTSSNELVVELPLHDHAVFEQLSKLRQLNDVEQKAVSDLYYAPRLAIVPFALIFSDFSKAVEYLIQESSERERFRFFQKEFALFYSRCALIAEHLSLHVTVVSQTEEDPKECIAVAWQIIKHLLADENGSTAWETDSGASPIDLRWNGLSGGAFAALLGLTGTGLLGDYKVGQRLRWYEIRECLSAFGHQHNKDNIPVPMIIPSLGVVPTSKQQSCVTFHNGFAIGEDSIRLGGAESFSVTWTGALLIEKSGAYQFSAQQPVAGCNDSWNVMLERGGKQWTVLSHLSESPCSIWLHRGVYELEIQFKSLSQVFDQIHRRCTGFQVFYCGPDTKGETCILPLDKLFIRSKDGPMKVESDCTAGLYLQGRYYSTIRDIRRTYQRAFKAIHFARAFSLYARATHLGNDHHEIGYLLGHASQFSGTSYYLSDDKWQSHHANLDFNFLPVSDPYHPPTASADRRAAPSPQRIAALFDWWERIFDYCCLRNAVKISDSRRLREPLWILFHEAIEKHPVDALIRLLNTDASLAPLVLSYFNGKTVRAEDLEDERWAIRVWNARLWIEKVQHHFFTRSLGTARPDLWASDDPGVPADLGNQNLRQFFETSCLQDSTVRRTDDIRRLNDELRQRAHGALISYLCAMQRIAIGDSFVTTPQDLSALLLQNVEVGTCEETSRIDDAISSVQIFFQRARIGIEPSATITTELGHMWDHQFATFEKWEAHQRRILYPENWIHWKELKVTRKSEAFRFFESELKRRTISMPKPNATLLWDPNQTPPLSILEPLQSTEFASFYENISEPEGISLVGQPARAGRPSLLASIKFENITATHSTDQPSPSSSAVAATSTESQHHFPLWFQAAVRVGTSFIRVAAAGVPPAVCGESAVMDEYYFWLVKGKYFSQWDMIQDAEIPSTTQPGLSTSAWDPPYQEGDESQLPTLLHWRSRPKYHLFWTRVRLGVFEPPRRSENGVELKVESADLKFTGRTVDSLKFIVQKDAGFRYDLATDSAVVLPQTVPDPDPPVPPQAGGLAAFPYFVYFEPGAPLVPTLPFCTTLAVAGTLRSHCRFEEAAKWCRSAFDPLQNSNAWNQRPKSPSAAKVFAAIPVDSGQARARAVLLEYVDILLQWGKSLLNRSADASQQVLVLFNEADRLLGRYPLRVFSQDIEDQTIMDFKALSAPLNPRLMSLYDRVEHLRAALQCTDSKKPANSGKALSTDSGIESSLSCYQPYRFASMLPEAVELAGLAKSLGGELLSAHEKGDAEYLDGLRITHERHLLDLGLEVRKRQWQESDWQVQSLRETMAGALARLHYTQELLSVGLISDENNYISSTKSASALQFAAGQADLAGQGSNLIPDFAFGTAGLGPYEATQVPIGTKIGLFFAAAGRILTSQSEKENTDAALSQTNAGWTRRSQEWQEEVNVITIEIAQIKRQILAAERARDSQLSELNNYQQQMEHSAEVQDFVRDKFTKQELYLFLQQETAGLYRQAYDLAYQMARKTQEAFCFERGVAIDGLPEPGWNNFHEGLMAGDRLELALHAMQRKYKDMNFREYEITKHVSLRADLPMAFLQLKVLGSCEVDLPEWMFDLDYPGQYMRRITNISLTLPCVVGPYVSVHCRLQLLSSSIRTDPSMSRSVCQDSERFAEPHVIHRFAATEAIATSSGQTDSGLFQLNFHDDRYLPFEFSGAVSRWRIELPQENNQFDVSTLSDLVMHFNYTSREGGHEMRRIANERSQRHLSEGGIKFFDLQHEFPDIFAMLLFKSEHKKHTDLPLCFRRNQFPFLTGRRAVNVTRIEIFIELLEHVEVGQHINIQFIPTKSPPHMEVDCIISSYMPHFYLGSFHTNIGPIIGDLSHEYGRLRVPQCLRHINQFYFICHYTTHAKDCCTCGDRKGGCSAQV